MEYVVYPSTLSWWQPSSRSNYMLQDISIHITREFKSVSSGIPSENFDERERIVLRIVFYDLVDTYDASACRAIRKTNGAHYDDNIEIVDIRLRDVDWAAGDPLDQSFH